MANVDIFRDALSKWVYKSTVVWFRGVLGEFVLFLTMRFVVLNLM